MLCFFTSIFAAIFERYYQNSGSKCGRKKSNFGSKMWSLVAKTRGSFNLMKNNSKNRREVSKRSLKIGGRSIRVVVSTIFFCFDCGLTSP